MSTHTPNVHTEKGNAVALTLLGLSVAILAGVFVLYFIGKSSPQPMYIPPPADEKVEIPNSEESIVNPREGWRKYNNEEFNFSLEYPEGWIVATGTLSTGDPVVSVYPAVHEGTTTVFGPQDETSHVSMYPLGVAVGGTIETSKVSNVVIQIPQASVEDYVLTSDRPWATKVTFERYPLGWNEAGFVFARIGIQDEEILYMREDAEISQYEFDPLMGDRIERRGFIDASLRNVEEEILQSFLFDGIHDEMSTNRVTEEKERFIIDSPEYGEIIKSPLSVRGKVFGKWFFEGDLSIRLETRDGEVLAEVPATPLGTSDEEDYTPFEVSLVFEDTTATSGQLLLGHSGSFSLAKDATNNKSISIVFDNE